MASNPKGLSCYQVVMLFVVRSSLAKFDRINPPFPPPCLLAGRFQENRESPCASALGSPYFPECLISLNLAGNQLVKVREKKYYIRSKK